MDMSLNSAETAPTAWWARAPAIVLDVAVGTALLYFLGWVRTDATYRTLNVNVSMLSLNPAVYVYRGFIVLLPAILLLGFIVVVASALHRRFVVRTPDTHKGQGRVRRALIAIRSAGWLGLTTTATATIAVVSQGGAPPYWLPYVLAASSAALGYADQSAAAKTHKGGRSRGVRASALVVLSVAGTLMIIMSYAERLGVQQGQQFLATAQDQPTVTLHTKERLSIAGAGVKVVRMTDEGSEFHYRYTGLVLLIRSGDDYLLAPRGLTPDSPRPVFVVPRDKGRLDLGTW
ncbi:hypothetical protein [Amycolatopsis australiensis]|uniref:hypothetical protein n=1 Tax=Amycolatopsis australiensis TaxID=546364 RepID=UPI00116140C7|nr:hypothetical protein [Amycolatopsis australiensis]